MLLDEYLDKIQEVIYRTPNGYAADSPVSVAQAAWDKERDIEKKIGYKCIYQKDKRLKKRCRLKAKITAAQKSITMLRCPKYKYDWQNRRCAKYMAKARNGHANDIKNMQAKLSQMR